MNTTASFPTEPSWSRRCSTETVFSIQGRETDFVQDSSDSELDSDEDAEYEPVTGTDEEAPISGATSGQSDDELIIRNVVSVLARDDGDLQLADSETGSSLSTAEGPSVTDGEGTLPAYWSCARCRNTNHNTRYRYCDKCFKVRKNFFPPRPRRKVKREASTQDVVPLAASQDSGFESLHSQELPSSQEPGPSAPAAPGPPAAPALAAPARLGKLKRRSESADRAYKRPRLGSESENEVEVAPLIKTISDPAVTIETLERDRDNLCIICLTEPKSGVFVHRRVAHICCCYNCAVKVWSKARRCPICNCKVSNVLKAVVM